MGRALKPEDRISHYRVVGPLGAGGMGEVYRARDLTLERDVALKVLPPRVVRSEERVRRFMLEAKSASSLNHPHIVTIHEIGQDQVRDRAGAAEPDSSPVHFIAMELVSGETLSHKIHEERADLRTLLGWLAQAAEGLAKAHAAGIVHRDLKPGNIMISRDGYAKVLDFGLAKLTEKQTSDSEAEPTAAPTATSERTGEGVVLGTVGYMSPEQVQGKPVDHRSDVFSFGCILYEAATGRRPFVADSDVETMHKILHDPPAPVEELNPCAPAELRRLIRRCLAKNLDVRFQSMKDLAIELREIVEEYESLSVSASSGSGTSTAVAAIHARSRSAMLAVVGAAVIVGAAGIALGLWGLRRARGPSDATPPPVRPTAVTSGGDVREAVLSSDGRYLAHLSGPSDRESLWVRQVATGSDVELLEPKGTSFSGLRFSPDGSYVFYLGRDLETPSYSALFQIASLGGPPRKRAFDVDSAVTFAPGGKHVCFLRGMPQKKLDALIVLDLESGRERTLATVEAPLRFEGAPSWSPGGERIAAIERSPTGAVRARVVAFDAETGRRETIGSHPWGWIASVGWLPDGRGLVLSANEMSDLSPLQVWLLSYPDGAARRVTNDWNVYWGLSVSADGAEVAAVRENSILNIWVVDVAGGHPPHPLTFASSAESTIFEFSSGEDGSVVFSSPREEAVHLSRIATDGSEPRPITSGKGFIFLARSLPGGGLVFERVGEDRVAHVWRADPDGGNARQVTDGPGEHLEDISPDGKTALFLRVDDPYILWAVPVSGGEPVRLASPHSFSALFSPDGSRIAMNAYVGEVQGRVRFAWRIIRALGGEPVATLTLTPRSYDVRWAPDGSALTFLDQDASALNVFRQRLDGGKPEPITRFTEGEVIGHEWSPDGKRLLLHRRIGSIENLWITAADGSGPVQLTHFATGDIGKIEWARDGSRVLFAYGSSSRDAVLIRSFR